MKPRSVIVAMSFAAGLALSASAADSSGLPRMKGKALAPSESGEVNLRVSFKLRLGELEGSGNFTVMDGSQANYVSGGEVPYEYGSAVEYKKLVTIVNCVPVLHPNKKGRARAECQFELSGPLRAGKLQAMKVMTFQYQTAFEVELGRPTVLVDEPDRRVEVMIEALP